MISLRRLFVVALLCAPALVSQEGQNLPFRNPDLPVSERVADLISHMTLEEKALQMQNAAPGYPAAGHPRLRMVERRFARRRARRPGHRLSAGNRPGRDVGTRS